MVCRVPLAAENAAVAVLMLSALTAVQSYAVRATDHANGIASIINAQGHVRRNATALVVMHPALRSYRVATHALAYAGKTVPLCVLFANLTNFYLWQAMDNPHQQRLQDIFSFVIAITFSPLKKWMR